MKRVKIAITAAALLCAAWIVPPLMRTVRNLCPTRTTAVNQVQAVPNFARTNKVACISCHSAWPTLNEQGRQFKMNGYRMERGKDEGMMTEEKGMILPRVFPMAGALVKLRPYDKSGPSQSGNQEFRHRSFHELEVFLTGNVGNSFSYFTEFEMEDETQYLGQSDADPEDAFQVKVAALQFGWHPSAYANVMSGYRSFLDMDPYQNYTNHGKLTRSSRDIAGMGYASGNSLGGEQQTTMVYGEAANDGIGSIYYAAGLTSDVGDADGGGKALNARIALDTMKGFMVGAFATAGRSGTVGAEADRYRYRRYGADMLIELGGLTARGAIVGFYDENPTSQAGVPGVRHFNKAAYVELMYPIMYNDRPILVPLVRQDYSTSNNGRDHAASITAQLGTYFLQNGKFFIEYAGETVDQHDVAVGATAAQAKNHRWTAQLEFGF